VDQTGRPAFAFEVTHAKLQKAFFGQYVHPPSQPSNKSLDASGSSAKLLGAAEGALIRAAASTQSLGDLRPYDSKGSDRQAL